MRKRWRGGGRGARERERQLGLPEYHGSTLILLTYWMACENSSCLRGVPSSATAASARQAPRQAQVAMSPSRDAPPNTPPPKIYN
jgi:hypothetical protein